jgi:dTDP-4-dehydro-6-deoxy-alpha-D-glucopyranose 2,3-dehydratase
VEHSAWIKTWLSEIKAQSEMDVVRIPFGASDEWVKNEGRLIHRSGRFFQVVGVRWHDIRRCKHEQPFFMQAEIGILGFIFYNFELMIQAKIEPGNMELVQLAPTCQATASNLDRVHGGECPLFSEWFSGLKGNTIYNSLQSEQGSRFFAKFNRNAFVIADSKIPLEKNFLWTPVDAVLELMHEDFLINTDARSAIVCCPWGRLVKRKAFSRFSSHIVKELAHSFNAKVSTQKTKDDVRLLRETIARPAFIRLDEMEGWQFGENSIVPDSLMPFQIYQIRVATAMREVSKWDQPVISSFRAGYAELACGRIEGILCFLFTLQIEAGLGNKVELGPSLVVEPGESAPEKTYRSYPGSVVLAECRQSDEGGRFYRDISLYRLIDIGDVTPDSAHGRWLNLAEIGLLLGEGGWFTNEARSALSLISYWL